MLKCNFLKSYQQVVVQIYLRSMQIGFFIV